MDDDDEEKEEEGVNVEEGMEKNSGGRVEGRSPEEEKEGNFDMNR